MKVAWLVFGLASNLAVASPVVKCPEHLPKNEGKEPAQLERVRVLGYMPGDELNEDALPEGPPDKQWKRGRYLFQSWDVKTGRPPMIYQVDCVYAGGQFLRMDVRSANVCLARWESEHGTLKAGSLRVHCE